VGAAARALACAGIGRWTLVEPHTEDFETARVVGVHAEKLFDSVGRAPDLRTALTGCTLSIGTTARRRAERPLLTPRQAAERLAAASGDVAMVFGDERSGLTSDEVDACDLLSTLPGTEDQPSWNLAQAIAIYAYEVRVAVAALSSATDRPESDPAALAAVDRALAAATEALGKPGLRYKLYKTIERARPTNQEAGHWGAFLKAIK
jgi:TrmH family RNA methyltransferase